MYTEQQYLESLAAVQKQALHLACAVTELRIDGAENDWDITDEAMVSEALELYLDGATATDVPTLLRHALIDYEDGDLTFEEVPKILETFLTQELPNMVVGFLPVACRIYRRQILTKRQEIRDASKKREMEERGGIEPFTGRTAYLTENVTSLNRVFKRGQRVSVVEYQDDGEYRVEVDTYQNGKYKPYRLDAIAASKLWKLGDAPEDDPRKRLQAVSDDAPAEKPAG